MYLRLALGAWLLASLMGASVAAPTVQATGPDPQQPSGLFIQSDIVGGTCSPQGRYAPGERVVFRARVLDPQTGEMARDATVTVRLDNGTTLPMRYTGHPANAPPTDEFWATSWTVPADASPGVVRYTVDAVEGARTGHFEPFNVESSLLTIVAAP